MLYSVQEHILLFLKTNTGLFEMIVGILTTCHTQYTSDSTIYISLFNL